MKILSANGCRRNDESIQEYVAAKQDIMRAVAKFANAQLYEEITTREGEKDMYNQAVIKKADSHVLTSDYQVLNR